MSRDTQFAGFVQMLFNEMKPDLAMLIVDIGRKDTATILKTEAIIKQDLARRAYDLVKHAVSETTGSTDISHVPDMTTWPEETKT